MPVDDGLCDRCDGTDSDRGFRPGRTGGRRRNGTSGVGWPALSTATATAITTTIFGR